MEDARSDLADIADLAGELSAITGRLPVEALVVVPIRTGRWLPPVLVGTGTAHCVPASPREVFRAALLLRADAVVVGHNHARRTGPSRADFAVTRRLVAAGALVGVPVLAHLVVEPGRWFDCVADGGRRTDRPAA
jgi:hypothetical protein